MTDFPEQRREAGDSYAASGLPGLDTILHGGLMPGRAYQVRGRPGTGKTIFSWYFLSQPHRTSQPEDEERSLLITFDESEAQLRADAERFGFDTEPVHILDLSPTSDQFIDEGEPESRYSTAEPDLYSVAGEITSTIQEVQPTRIAVDSISHFRQFVTDSSNDRTQVLSLLRYLKEGDATVLLISELEDEADASLNHLSDGVIELQRGSFGRTIQLLKQRGHGFREGAQPVSLDGDGMRVHPQFAPSKQTNQQIGDMLSSGIPELDELLGGGIAEQTISMLSGPSGVGKTTLGLQFMKEAAGRGKPSVLYSFEEETSTMMHRATSVSIPVQEMVADGTLKVRQYRPWSFQEGQFINQVRQDTDQGGQIVMIDSVSSYEDCGDPERMRASLIRLTKHLVAKNVTVLLVNEIQDITGTFRVSEENLSHLADNLVFLRYLEMRGKLKKAIGVLKKRSGSFENSLREFSISEYGIRVGEPLTNLRGVLSGNPEWTGDESRT